MAGLAVAGALLQWPIGAHAQAGGDVQAQLDELANKMAALERKQGGAAADAAAPPSSAAVTGGDLPGSFKLPGSNTSLKLGGYVKLDAIFSDRSAGVGSTGDQEYEAGSVPVGPTAGANERNQVKLHARQSRLFLQSSTPVLRYSLARPDVAIDAMTGNLGSARPVGLGRRLGRPGSRWRPHVRPRCACGSRAGRSLIGRDPSRAPTR